MGTINFTASQFVLNAGTGTPNSADPVFAAGTLESNSGLPDTFELGERLILNGGPTEFAYIGIRELANQNGRPPDDDAVLIYTVADPTVLSIVRIFYFDPTPSDGQPPSAADFPDPFSVSDFFTLEYTIPCFLAGTRIATADEEKAVETLTRSDQVRTADGLLVPVR